MECCNNSTTSAVKAAACCQPQASRGASCCSGTSEAAASGNGQAASFIDGQVVSRAGRIPRVKKKRDKSDYIGMVKSRATAFRMDYSVEPGVYAVGMPDEKSDIFVSANYKLSFDTLRKELEGLNAWILVIDTKGINVWCAAGKGTFGTDEIIFRIKSHKLDDLVGHKRIVLPQIGRAHV